MTRLLRENWMIILVAVGMAFGFIFLRTVGDELASTEAFDAQLTNGTPTLVEFYSNT